MACGSWEIKAQSLMLLGILHTDVTTLAWSFGLRNLMVPGHIMPVAGMPYDHARNAVCQQALLGGYDWCAFLDSDVIPPPDAFVRLMRHNQKVVSGLYCRRSPPHGLPVMIRRSPAKDAQGNPAVANNWVTQFPANALIEVDLVGAGCLLIHRTVLESLPHQRPGRPWFEWRVDMQGVLPPNECLSEDFTFNAHCAKHGIKTLVDTSVICRHVGYAEAGPGTFIPLNTTPVT